MKNNNEMDLEVMAMVNQHKSDILPVVACIIPEKEALEIKRSLQAVEPDRAALKALQEERAAQIEAAEHRRQELRVVVPTISILVTAVLAVGAFVEWINPIFASVLSLPWLALALAPFAPWRNGRA